MKILRRFYNYYISHFTTLESQARRAGVRLGKNNFIDSKFWSSEPYLITVGSDCQITGEVRFFTHGGGQAVRHIDPTFDCFGKISVGDYVYIGNGSIIMPGVTIGNHVLIAAGSVVTKSIPSDVVVGGNPAKIICSISDYKERNEKYNIHSKSIDSAQKKSMLIRLDEDKFIKKTFLTE